MGVFGRSQLLALAEGHLIPCKCHLIGCDVEILLHMKRREFNRNLAAATAVILSPFPRVRVASAATAGGATLVFSYPNFSGSLSALSLRNGSASGSMLYLVNTQPGHTGGCAWYGTKQPPGPFTTQFSFQPQGLGSSVVQSGMTFCVQDVAAPPGQAGFTGDQYIGDANMCGYGAAFGSTNDQYPCYDSLCVKFDAGNESSGQNYPKGGLPTSTGMYFNGGPAPYPGSSLGLVPENDLNPYGINLYSSHTFQVTIVYDGSLLTMTILDTTTNAQARFAWPLNLANTTNATGNYVGFTAGTSAQGYFYIHNWSYWSGYNTRLGTPTFSPAPGQHSGAQTVTISYPAGSTCYYTTNGLLPTSSSTQYTGPITVSANAVIQAVAIQSNYTDSLVGTGSYQINNSNVINFPSGFSAGNLIPVGFAYLSGSAYRVTDTTQGTVGAAWFPIPVAITSFSTTFTLQWGGSSQGMCFVIQNNPPPLTSPANANPGVPSTQYGWSAGPTAIGAEYVALGYGGMDSLNRNAGKGGHAYGILNSIAIAFDQSTQPNSVGLYTNGNNPQGSQIATGLTFSSGHAFRVVLSYSGTTLSLTMTDTATSASFTHSWTVDIPSTVGWSDGYVGFTGATYGAAAVAAIQSWTYAASTAAIPVPAPPTNLVVK
jgi:hypothetical protein